MSGAQTGAAAPKLRRSSFSFVGAGRAKIASGLKIEKADVGVQLEETNRILIEIQKQLALDFGNRIVEKRQLIAASKAQVSRQRASDKESAIESMRKSGAGIIKVFEKVAAPAKGIFQRILDFFSIILTGLLVNNAFKWLENPANRAKVEKFFNFVVKHWKELLALYGTYKLIKIVAALKSIADLFKKPPKWPGGGGKGGGGGGGPSGCGAIAGCGAQIVKVISDNAIAIAAVLAGALGRFFQPAIGSPAVAKPTAPVVPPPFDPTKDFSYYAAQGMTRGQWNKLRMQNLNAFSGGSIDSLSGIRRNPELSAMIYGAVITALAGFGILRGGAGGLAPRLTGSAARDRAAMDFARGSGDPAAQAQMGLERLMGPTLRPKVGNTNLKPDTVSKFLERAGYRKEFIGRSFGGTIPGLSGGGTVGGTGSGSIDSVRALLAPGEEVIRASAAMLFRPLLKDINNNAGRLWNTLSTAVISLIKSNETLESGMRRLKTELDNFKIQLDSFISQEKLRKEKNKGGGIGQMPAPPRTGMVAPEVVLHSDIKQPPRRRAKSSVVPIQLPPQTLPPTNMPKFSAEGGVATEEPDIGSTNSINPYMVLTPQILGIFV